ncbi:tRNA lysidine(34) synthetase TilS [Ornithobacterium rhinotracheale]|uniref:tRNA(Ile)-lysidine synthase n=1 Tax=Ornithobacterium rhinotracheale (strain ATCC 51463 / DSM 15997 / CCUG 23171 / CIP 104009 / LMG 9086) TaxID=867902 RepID=I4A146_ORNRL|nr:tRNA lysidine(34) synthetase TilS [Ornithobacterium rhinotracheale]AFL97680.1 tRNA(Ile)-lysidine synthetase [Ornithobacterium rhinotracheale DSM 15997]AIP98815.1 potassium-transporting ATPase subunit C [Ornithobacterium rhinotracheale ORT-UMN 88]KGB67170.1 hypothetical protein Q787_02190 [Ornithobacterium rhinotracheale H06-030791]MCK0195267.1 tRNA lysidine(34) synthetase TilS [Ornithobacterium rhinotracheale]MCK0203084.1 tRNA lysidine(34) synthetase TilS [Ornithobacterium rhinotracheale]
MGLVSDLDTFFNKKILVATSGGADSMVLLHLLHSHDIKVAAAHMNFNLRPKDCDKDQALVKSFCKEYGIDFFTKSVDTKSFKKENKLSTQMAARELRYAWFRKIIEKQHFDCLATAHHLDDNIETLIINLLRGSGIEGVAGMEIFNNGIWRPLLKTTKKQILEYAIAHNIPWREDKSNAENDYLRNHLRNVVLPELEEKCPEYRFGFEKSINFLQQDEMIIDNHIQALKDKLFSPNTDNSIFIKIKELSELIPLDTYLFHLFKTYGFTAPQEIKKLIYAENSAEIANENYRLIKDRKHLILTKNEKIDFDAIYFLALNEEIHKPFSWKFTLDQNKNSQNLITFDADKVSFPLKLRKPQNGDFFYPAGMNGKKKLSKFFKDLKLNKLQKEKTWVLTTANDEIMWVVGMRQDQRFTINKNTELCLNLQKLD